MRLDANAGQVALGEACEVRLELPLERLGDLGYRLDEIANAAETEPFRFLRWTVTVRGNDVAATEARQLVDPAHGHLGARSEVSAEHDPQRALVAGTSAERL